MNNSASEIRPKVKQFYKAIESNDIATLKSMIESGFPVEWAQAFSHVSLPELAMKNNSVEACWFLMSKGIMPENWASFTGNAWKGFIKKGFNMAMTKGESTIPMSSYANILKIALQKTGEKLPSALENSSLFFEKKIGSLSDKLSKRFLAEYEKVSERNQTLSDNVVEKRGKAKFIEPRKNGLKK